jgi:hypothetical protein
MTVKLLVEQAVSQLMSTSAGIAALQKEMQSLASVLPEYQVVMQMSGVGPSLGPQLMAESALYGMAPYHSHRICIINRICKHYKHHMIRIPSLRIVSPR